MAESSLIEQENESNMLKAVLMPMNSLLEDGCNISGSKTEENNYVEDSDGAPDVEDSDGLISVEDSDGACESLDVEDTTLLNSSSQTTAAEQKEVNIVLAGKSGAGKSTLALNILHFRREEGLCVGHGTKKCEAQENTVNGITIRVTDTVGLGDKKRQRKKELKKMSQYTKGRADLLVYCISVYPSSKFEDGNPSIMKSLQDAYGRAIWKQCFVVFTFSNATWDWLKKNTVDEDEAIAKYKKYLLEHATMFKEELKKLKVNVNIREVFGFQTEFRPDDQPTIVAIPAGQEPNDPVLPDVIGPARFYRLDQSLQIDISDWTEVLFIEIVRKCDADLKRQLLQYRYGREMAKSLVIAAGGITSGATGGTVGGAAIGAGAGAIVGLVGGPLGVASGAVLGAVVGGAVGMVGGGTGGGIATQVRKLKEKLKKKK